MNARARFFGIAAESTANQLIFIINAGGYTMNGAYKRPLAAAYHS